ncbi:MAG: hypothetical protein UX31_C0001G0037 [Candidatus Nomurabacteria bacterium GW2011_GWA1_46_11]|uniref:Uncharacterized protein n=1 Tax=Candidatus Nomurabacteria bacterium GW2011_GWA1_46_11 TaxID=1618732 RepID=A0A0G1NPB6_9BACT|nr:MAG: hypothetical protein UX31_C0001G0037 [Candidatus Nomurabacteria bacterium GW2011_GWA1_46_11]
MKVTYKQANNLSKEEAQLAVDRAYDILFEAVLKHREEENRNSVVKIPSK